MGHYLFKKYLWSWNVELSAAAKPIPRTDLWLLGEGHAVRVIRTSAAAYYRWQENLRAERCGCRKDVVVSHLCHMCCCVEFIKGYYKLANASLAIQSNSIAVNGKYLLPVVSCHPSMQGCAELFWLLLEVLWAPVAGVWVDLEEDTISGCTFPCMSSSWYKVYFSEGSDQGIWGQFCEAFQQILNDMNCPMESVLLYFDLIGTLCCKFTNQTMSFYWAGTAIHAVQICPDLIKIS